MYVSAARGQIWRWTNARAMVGTVSPQGSWRYDIWSSMLGPGRAATECPPYDDRAREDRPKFRPSAGKFGVRSRARDLEERVGVRGDRDEHLPRHDVRGPARDVDAVAPRRNHVVPHLSDEDRRDEETDRDRPQDHSPAEGLVGHLDGSTVVVSEEAVLDDADSAQHG